jgi:hypothetical protein
MVTGGLDDDAEIQHPLTDCRRLLGGGLQRLGVADHLDTQVQAEPVHRADQRMLVAQPLQPCLEVSADAKSVVLQPLITQHVEHRHPDRAGQRAAAGRGEEVSLAGERISHRAAGDHRSERIAVAYRFGHRHDVGHRVLLLETPEPLAQPAVSDLHLVGDCQATACAYRRIDLLQVALG